MREWDLMFYIDRRNKDMFLIRFLRMLLKKKFMKILANDSFHQSLEDTTHVYLLMEQQAQVRPTQWSVMMRILEFQSWQLMNFSKQSMKTRTTSMNSKFHTLRSTMKSSETFWLSTQKTQSLIFEKIQSKDSNLLEWRSIELMIQNRWWNSSWLETDVEQLRQQMQIKRQVDHMQFFNSSSTFSLEQEGQNKKSWLENSP